MDVRFINPFINSVRQVFKTMAQLDITVDKPRMKTNETADVCGVIGFSGDAIGTVVLSFPRDVACKIATSFSGVEMTVDHPDFSDAIGELANMVAGGAKSQFPGVSVSISLPTVAVGRTQPISVTTVPSNSPRLIIPCRSVYGSFFVEVVVVIPKMNSTCAPAVAVAGVGS